MLFELNVESTILRNGRAAESDNWRSRVKNLEHNGGASPAVRWSTLSSFAFYDIVGVAATPSVVRRGRVSYAGWGHSLRRCWVSLRSRERETSTHLSDI